MTDFQIFIGLLLMACMVLRPFLYKPVALIFNLNMSSLFTSTWLMLGLVITFPVLGHLLTNNVKEVLNSPYVWLSILKGVSMWFAIKMQQALNKESTSSSTFFLFISMAFSSFINNIFFHEGLKVYQLLSIICLGLIGLLFFVYGDARRLSNKGKIAFIVVVLFWTSFHVEDHLAISHIGWYPHLLISSLFMFLTCFFNKVTINDLKMVFKNRTIAIAGIFYTASEFLIIYSMINIMPVSFVCLFLRLAIPIIMIISAIRFREQSVKNQLLFGLIAIAFAIPIILIK